MAKAKTASTPVAPTPAPAAAAPSRRAFPWPPLAVLVFALIVFRVLLAPGHVLFTTDDNIGALAMRKAALPWSFLGGWDDSIALGQPVFTNFTWTNILLTLLPLRFFTNWIHALDLIVGSLAILGWLRARGFSVWAQLLGALTALWVGSTFFLTYAGHLGKFGVVMFAALYLWLIEKAVRGPSLRWAVLAGGAMGAMFLEQADVGLFFALPLGAYAVWGVVREHGFRIPLLLRGVLPVAVVAGALAFHPVWMAHSLLAIEKSEAKGGVAMDDRENWDYCTQWSWPPGETIEFVAPGYMGWRSGEAEGPYWGRMGRSAGWEQTRQGFQNFRLESLYLGAIPVWLGLLGFALAFRRGASQRGDLIFWSAVAVVTFLLALGKFFPLYRLFYELPGMSSIRNPVKFMQVFQFALAFLAAAGCEALLRAQGEGLRRVAGRGAWAAVAAGGLFAVWGLILGGSQSDLVSRFAQEGWGDYARVIARNIAHSVNHASLVFLLAGGLGVALVRWAGTPRARVLAGLLVAAAAVDQLSVSHHYVTPMRAEGFFAENLLTRHLKQSLGVQRTYLLAQQSFYNLWLTYLFPYHQIPSLNITQMRMPDDYKQFFAAFAQQPLRLWQLAAVGAVIGPTEMARQLAGPAETRDRFPLSFGFNVGGAPGGGVAVVNATSAQPPQHVVLQHKAPAARYQLIGAWQVQDEAEILKELAQPGGVLFQRALLTRSEAATALPAGGAEGAAGTVEVVSYRAGQVVLKVNAARPAILRAADKHEVGWQATLDGQPRPVLRCDFLCQGVFVEAGVHEVVLTYRPSARSLAVQGLGLAACLLAGLALVVKRKA